MGPRIPKGQLSRVPWPGNSWMPFTFQPALWVLQQPQKHSHSLQLATYSLSTSTSLHSIGFIYSFSPRGFLQSTTWPHQSTVRPLERAASHIKGTRPPCLFRLPPWENVNRSTTVSDVILLIIHEHDFVDVLFPTLTSPGFYC